MNDNMKVRFSLDKNGFFAGSAVILLILTAIFRVIGCWGIWGDRINMIMLVLLPVCCSLLMILCILLFGRRGFFLSIIPVLLGVVFFVFKALSFTSWVQTVLCILLYLTVAVVYTATVFGWIHTKWLLPPLFGLPLLYHVVMIDLPALNNTVSPVSFSAGMQEMSILCIMGALLCVGLGLKKRPGRVRDSGQAAKPEPVQPAVSPAQAPVPAPDSVPDPAPENPTAVSEEVHSSDMTPEPEQPQPAEIDSEESSHD